MKTQEIHPFIATLFELVQPVLLSGSASATTLEGLRAKTHAQLKWPPDAFLVDVFLKAGRLNSVPDELRRIRVLMAAIPTTQVLKRAGMTKTEFIHYHLSSYRIVAASALDRGLELCNAALGLGIKSTSLKLDKVLAKVSAPLHGALEILKASALPLSLSEQRNDYVHRGYVHQLPELEHIGMIEFVKRVDRLALPRVPSKMLIAELQFELAALRPRMMSQERGLRIAVNGLLTALIPAFTREHEGMKLKWSEVLKTEVARRKRAQTNESA